MRAGLLQTGQCVFCEFRQTCFSPPLVRPQRRGLKVTGPALGRDAHLVRKVQARDRPRELRSKPSTNPVEGVVRKFTSRDASSRERALKPWAQKSHMQIEREDFRRRLLLKSKGSGTVRLSLNQDPTKRPKADSLRGTLDERLDAVEEEIQSWDGLKNLKLTDEERTRTFAEFRDYVIQALMSTRVRRSFGARPGSEADERMKLVSHIEDAYRSRSEVVLDMVLKYAYYGRVANSKFSTLDLRNQQNLADLRYPLEWYPRTRSLQRKIHLHVGPTNSGKTYHALKALEAAKTGLYAGPLRLLAHEVYTRLNAAGRRCQLVTGEERRFPDDDASADMVSCTVEMIDCNTLMDVAVIDEIQLIGSDMRGWAWTQALLGVLAKEVHLCGEERTVPLIKELAAMMGDTLELHRYERLSPLQMDSTDLHGDMSSLRKGDCIVSFSVLGIHALKQSIERQTRRNVAIVYGGLPPETRAQQARLFNDPDNDYDILVASDAVGMGLNLSIKRVIFESSTKNDGSGMRTLKVSEVKQIAGRAGRYRTAHQAVKDAASSLDASVPEVQPTVEVIGHAEDAQPAPTSRGTRQTSSEAILSSDLIEDATSGLDEDLEDTKTPSTEQDDPSNSNTGLVTTLYGFDFPVIKEAMQLEPEPITSAGLQPPSALIERFASYFPPGTPFSYVLLQLNDISQMNRRFHACGMRDNLMIADALHSIEGLTTADRIIICAAPVSLNRDPAMKGFLQALASAIANQHGGALLDIPASVLPLERIDLPTSGGRRYLQDMEQLHKMIILYLWLSHRFSGVFSTRQLAFYVKNLIEQRIDQALSKFNFTEEARRRLKAAREQKLLEEIQDAAAGVSAHTPGEGEDVEFSGGEDRIEGPAVKADDAMAETLHEGKDAEYEGAAEPATAAT